MALIDENFLTDIAHKSDLLRAADGDLDKISGVANVKEALFRRLLTTPGALAHRPEYGVGVKDFQNGLNSLDEQRELANRIKSQYERDFRVKEVTGVRFEVDDTNPSRVTIIVKVDLNGLEEASLEFVPFGERI